MTSAPVLYDVSIAVDPDVADAYLAWLDTHVPEVLAAGDFLDAAVYTLADAPDGRRQVVVQYAVPTFAALQAYLAGPAVHLRADAEARFGGRFDATRRVLVRRD